MTKYRLILLVFLAGCAVQGNRQVNKTKPCFTLMSCKVAIQKKIERYWRIPVDSPAGLEVKIRVRLNENGGIKSFFLEKPSGSLAYDDSVLKAVVRASPFTTIVAKRDGVEMFDEIAFSFKRNKL